MTRRIMLVAVVLALTLCHSTIARGQEQDAASGRTAIVPLSVEVAISRYQADEPVGSRPYVLAVTAGVGESSLELNDRVPVPVGPANAGPDGVRRPVSFNYATVGTQISCMARTRGDGRFEVNVSIYESSVVGYDRTATDLPAVPYPPVFRSFQSSNTLVLRDGESRQFLAAADPVTGETIRVDVTLTVLQ